jgi:hypothetical protein
VTAWRIDRRAVAVAAALCRWRGSAHQVESGGSSTGRWACQRQGDAGGPPPIQRPARVHVASSLRRTPVQVYYPRGGSTSTPPPPHGPGLPRGLAPHRRRREIPIPPQLPRHGLRIRRGGRAREGGRGADDLRGGRRRQLRHLLPPHQGKPPLPLSLTLAR